MTDVEYQSQNKRGYQTVKREQKYHLLYGTKVVATDTGVFGRDSAQENYGQAASAVFQITQFTDPGIIQASCNPFEEPLNKGQFTIRGNANATPLELPDTPHSNVRKIATDNYLKAANRQRVNFDASLTT